ncbi:restriction endonuclease subunit S [Mycolicibacterium porcinum]|uniref:Restriction endonuclease subunit S n=1 Tax=Mycolicibacterium porcinum TaxID=39693 RepID=A0ABV3VEG6_9MYCO
MNGWRSVRVADIAAPGSNSMATGPFGSSIGARFFHSSGIPIIRGGNLSSESGVRLQDKDDMVFLQPAKAAEFSRSTVRRGDLVFTCWGTINQVGLIDKSARYDSYVISNKQMKLTPDPAVADSEFLYYLFSGPQMQREILDGSIGSSIPGFNLTRLRNLVVALPPLGEQRAIARSINDASDQIFSLERLIAKKKAIKQGMMQQLLTGRARLPGFTDDWRQSTVGAEFDVQLGKMLDAAKNAGVVKPYLGNRAVQWGRIDVSAVGSVPMTPSDIHRYRLQAGDLLVCEGGEVGRSAIWRNELSECYFQKALHRLRPKNGYDIRVMQALLELWSSVGSFADYVTQTSIAHLPREKFVEMPLPLPSITEQTAIGDLVEDLDREIACVDRRIVKHRAIKQGMMQQLLTGRTRLPGASAS